MLLSSTGLLMLLHSWFLPGTRAFSTSSSSLSDTRPHVHLSHATVLGRVHGSAESFLGIPYAQPPVGDLRLRLPRAIDSYHGTVDAASFGNQCIQQGGSLPSNLPSDVLEATVPYFGRFAADPSVPQSEDCLNLNIIRPWIYGGFFAVGSNTTPLHNGTAIVQRSIHLGQPVIYVAVNYRVNVFGFLGGAEVEKAGIGNLGLQDQRTALHWVQKHISSFGGDPNKVMIWGESAGSMSLPPALGYPHGHDLFLAFGPDDMTDYFIRFVNKVNPNGDTGVHWPRYDITSRAILQFKDGDEPLTVSIAADDERLAGTSELASLSLRFPVSLTPQGTTSIACATFTEDSMSTEHWPVGRGQQAASSATAQ